MRPGTISGHQICIAHILCRNIFLNVILIFLSFICYIKSLSTNLPKISLVQSSKKEFKRRHCCSFDMSKHLN